jgi:hypothetical protein
MNAMVFIKRFNDEMREVVSEAKPRKAGKRKVQRKTPRKAVPNKIQQRRSRAALPSKR